LFKANEKTYEDNYHSASNQGNTKRQKQRSEAKIWKQNIPLIVPVLDGAQNIKDIKAYNAPVVIRETTQGKKAYDILKIKENPKLAKALQNNREIVLNSLLQSKTFQPTIANNGSEHTVASQPEKSSPEGQEGKKYSISDLFTGSAAEYMQPSLHYVGTGEGAQVYGWGLYATDNEEIARWYADKDAEEKYGQTTLTYQGQTMNYYNLGKVSSSLGLTGLEEQAVRQIFNVGGIDKAIDSLEHEINHYKGDIEYYEGKEQYRVAESYRRELELSQKKLDFLKEHKEELVYKEGGTEGHRHLYRQTWFTNRVNKGEANLLDWSGRVTEEQKRQIQEALNKEPFFPDEWKKFFNRYDFKTNTGQELYNRLSFMIDSPRQTSEFLFRAGIDGIRYPANSHGQGDGSKGWNYVSFSDTNMRVDEHTVFSLTLKEEDVKKESPEFQEVYHRYRNTPQWMKAPNGKPSNLNERQWVQVRTPSFKKWAGDWEAWANSIGQRAAKSITEAVALVKSLGILNRDLENVTLGMKAQISGNGLSKMESETATEKSVSTRLHALAIANVDRLFQNAFTETTHSDTHGRKEVAQVHRLGSILLDPETDSFVPVMLTVVEYQQYGNKIYSIEAVDVQKYENSAGQLADSSKDDTQAPIAEFVKNITQYAKKVNSEGATKVVDENGEPLALWHGDRPSKNGSIYKYKNLANDQNSQSAGIYLTNDKSYAEGFNGEVRSFFVNIRNPWIGKVNEEDFASEDYDYEDMLNYMPRFAERMEDAIVDAAEKAVVRMEAEMDAEELKNDELYHEALDIKENRLDNWDFAGLLRESKQRIFAPEIAQAIDKVEDDFLNNNAAFATMFLQKWGYDGQYDSQISGQAPGVSQYVVFDPNQIKSATDNSGAFSTKDDHIQFSLVEKPSPQMTREFNDPDAYITTYRAAILQDGKLYPPMATDLKGVGKNEGMELGRIYQSDEHPELIDRKTGKFPLVSKSGRASGAGSDVLAAYAPYFHSSDSMLNDQFSVAYDKPDMVTVECRVLKSDLDSKYQAEGSPRYTGLWDWKAGPVSSKIFDNGARPVYLSRYIMPVRIVPNAEVASNIKQMLGDRDISIPANVVNDSLREELERAGVKVEGISGLKTVPPALEKYAKENGSELHETNRIFNEELENYDSLNTGHVFKLGIPGDLLQDYGFSTNPLELSKRVIETKSHDPAHPFTVQELKNLPEALQKPLAIFKYTDPAKLNLIVDLSIGEKKFLVGVQLDSTYRGNAVNNIRGLLPKDTHEWLNWIQQDKALYLDKEKIQALINQSGINLLKVGYLNLEVIKKIIREFDNSSHKVRKSVNNSSFNQHKYSLTPKQQVNPILQDGKVKQEYQDELDQYYQAKYTPQQVSHWAEEAKQWMDEINDWDKIINLIKRGHEPSGAVGTLVRKMVMNSDAYASLSEQDRADIDMAHILKGTAWGREGVARRLASMTLDSLPKINAFFAKMREHLGDTE
jgi:hypothetical protein